MSPESDTPFRIVILGDFSGRGALPSNPAEVPRLRARRIDRDNFDEQFEKLNVQFSALKILPGANDCELHLRDLDSFHPDFLFKNLSVFASLRDLRARLDDSDRFQAAADEVMSWGQVSTTPKPEEAGASAPPTTTIDSENLLDQILEPQAEDAVFHSPKSEWQRMIDDIVSPYLVQKADPRQSELIEVVDRATQAIMTDILQDPRFQKLESAWRALHFLIRRLETSPSLNVHIVDISKAELVEDVLNTKNLRESRLYRLLVEQTVETPDGEPWSVVAGNFEFGPTDDDTNLLGRIAEIAQSAGAPFLAAADSKMFGAAGNCDSPTLDFEIIENQSAWQSLRSSPVASHIGLAWPSFLLRLPYGAESNPVEQFNYEEHASSEQLLWGNSAFIACLLLGQAFAESGWSMSPGEVKEVSRLPVWTYDDDGEPQLHPCGRYLITERTIEALQSHGFMPILSLRDSDTIRLGGFYSFTSKRLAGPWD